MPVHVEQRRSLLDVLSDVEEQLERAHEFGLVLLVVGAQRVEHARREDAPVLARRAGAVQQRVDAEIVVRHHASAAEHPPRDDHRLARLVDALRHVQHLGVPADAADDLHVEAGALHAARDQRRCGPCVRRVDLERRRDEEEEAAAALDHDDVAGTGSERIEADAADLGVLGGGDRLVETVALDRDRDVSGRQRDPAGLCVLLGLERIFVCACQQAVPEAAPPPAPAAGVAREFDRDLRGGQPDQPGALLEDAGAGRKDGQPAQPCLAGPHRERPGVRVGGRRQVDDLLTIGVLGQQVAHRRRDRALAGPGDREVAPLCVLDQDGRVDRRRQVGGQRLSAAAARRDARQRLCVGEQRLGAVSAYRPGGDHVLVVHRLEGFRRRRVSPSAGRSVTHAAARRPRSPFAQRRRAS